MTTMDIEKGNREHCYGSTKVAHPRSTIVKKTSVFEMTKDLMMLEYEEPELPSPSSGQQQQQQQQHPSATEEAREDGGGVDWGWGGEEENDNDVDPTGNHHHHHVVATAAMGNAPGAAEDEDSDATVEMESGDEEEEENKGRTNANALSPPTQEGNATPATATDPGEQDVGSPTMKISGEDRGNVPSKPTPAESSSATADEGNVAAAGEPSSTLPPLPAKKKKLALYESPSSSDEDNDGDEMELDDNEKEVAAAAAAATKKDKTQIDEEPDAPPSPPAQDCFMDDQGTNAAEDENASSSTRLTTRARRKPSKAAMQDEEEAEESSSDEEVVNLARKPPHSTNRAKKSAKHIPDNEEADADDEAEQEEEPSPPRPKPFPKKEVVPAAAATATGGEQPDEEDLLRSTDYLFLEANKDEVTVADICRALSAEYDCKLSKANKKLVRLHLIDLMKGNVEPQVAARSGGASEANNQEGKDDDNEEEEQEEEDQVSEQGDLESEQSDFDHAADDSEEEYEDGATATAAAKSIKKAKNIKKTSRKAKQKDTPTNQKPKKQLKPKRPSQRKAAKNARMVEAERLRKKRMEELRIRNEEMQLNQSKEEQERAEAIAAKFETNTDELRLKRLEDRLTLLELLDKKRIAIIDALESKIEQKEAATGATRAEAQDDVPVDKSKDDDEEEEESDESSSDEEELDIVGLTKPIKPLKPIHTHLPSRALNILKQTRTPQAKNKQRRREESVAQRATGKTQDLLSPTQRFKANAALTSPTKSMGARTNLRQVLKQKVRKQGNLWLARELGYKNEEEHLKECNIVADEKRAFVRKMEQARVVNNERRLLRDRILLQDEGALAAAEEENGLEKPESESPDEEEDEEMQMAREIEQAEDQAGETPAEPQGDTAPETNENTTSETGATGQSVEANINETAAVVNDLDESGGFPTEDDTQDESSPQWETQQPVPPTEAPISTQCDESSEDHSKSSDNGEDAASSTVNDDLAKKSEDKSDPSLEDSDDDDEGEIEFTDDKPKKDPNRDRNAGWKAMLEKEAARLKKQKKNKQGLVEDQAEEEEEEEVAGLEDFGFSIKKKKQDDDDEDVNDDKLDEDDLKHVVDEVSDDEGDEEAGEAARKKQERIEEKEQHKEILRRMREGYDGRRGGIAGGGVGARGMHRFDQLVAADNREDAKRLGLLNDDELDSEDENDKQEDKKKDDEDDEAALLDKMLKDRFLHRTDVDVEENFSDDEENPEETNEKDAGDDSEAEEERTQERLAKRFAKRARMQRLEEEYADSQEFSQQRLIDEDESMRQELSQMKNGLVRKRSVSSSTRSSFSSSQDSSSNAPADGHKRPRGPNLGSSLVEKTGASLSIALRASRTTTMRRTSFLGGDKAGITKENGALIHKSVALSHVVFASANRGSSLSSSGGKMGDAMTGKRKRVTAGPASSSLFQKVARKVQ